MVGSVSGVEGEKKNRSFSLSYTSRRNSTGDTVADVAASFDNPGSDAAVGERISTWLAAIFSLPHHAGPSAAPFPVPPPGSGDKINTNFNLNASSRREASGDTDFDISMSFENPHDRQRIYDNINVWLKAAGIALEYRGETA